MEVKWLYVTMHHVNLTERKTGGGGGGREGNGKGQWYGGRLMCRDFKKTNNF